ncbi:unnamed protein product [Calypogeia fissa]
MKILEEEKSPHWLWCLLVICIASSVSPVKSQAGFISIDCGSNESYTDNVTGIQWSTDDAFISTGKNVDNLFVESNTSLNERQVGSLKFFDTSRSKNCYSVAVQSGQTYVIRATFYMGNLSNIGANGSFEVWVDFQNWIGFPWDDSTRYIEYMSEMIYNAPASTVDVCLARLNGPTFISALEFRPLSPGMYSKVVGQGLGSWLDVRARVNCGANETSPIQYWRYQDDLYDRIWSVFGPGDTFNSISNSSISSLPNTYGQDPDRPPQVVMETAWYDSNNITVTFDGLNPGTGVGLYIAAYFLELNNTVSATNFREMNLYVDGNFIKSFNSSDTPLEIIYITDPQHADNLAISIQRADSSPLGPILNAYEVSSVVPYYQGATDPQDASNLLVLQSALNLSDWTGDPCIPHPYDWLNCDYTDPASPHISALYLASQGFGGNIPSQISLLRALTNLTLNNNSFTGPIPNSLSVLVNLEAIYLQDNDLSGEIPDFLGTSFPNLTQLNLDNNNLTGAVPSDLSKAGLNFTVLNNPFMTCIIPGCGNPQPAKALNIGAVVGGMVGGLVALAIASWLLWTFCTRRRRSRLRIIKEIGQAESQSVPESISMLALGSSVTLLTLQEVSDATKRFSKKIGEGSFGPVYYGKLPNGQEVAVKVKKKDSHQGVMEFLNEVRLLSRIHHRNLVSLVGSCDEENQQILVYVYISNGTLRDHLYGVKSSIPLDWSTRLDIALNSAKGLEYLHTDCHPRIIHRDVKSSNILLDENMVAKVADFGISKQAPEGIFTGVDTLLKGTIGYLDPAYFESQRLTPKSDVYSFGVVLLEIISGRHPHLTQLPDGTAMTLIEWVRSKENEGNAMDVIDPTLHGQFDESMIKVLSLAIRCVNPLTARRPDMAHVVRTLTEAVELVVSNSSVNEAHNDPSGAIHEDTDGEKEVTSLNLENLPRSDDFAAYTQGVIFPR